MLDSVTQPLHPNPHLLQLFGPPPRRLSLLRLPDYPSMLDLAIYGWGIAVKIPHSCCSRHCSVKTLEYLHVFMYGHRSLRYADFCGSCRQHGYAYCMLMYMYTGVSVSVCAREQDCFTMAGRGVH